MAANKSASARLKRQQRSAGLIAGQLLGRGQTGIGSLVPLVPLLLDHAHEVEEDNPALAAALDGTVNAIVATYLAVKDLGRKLADYTDQLPGLIASTEQQETLAAIPARSTKRILA